MPLLLGCIADDFTGATDLANTLVKGGMTAVQVIGVPTGPLPEADAIIIALKSRTAPVGEAVTQSLAACEALLAVGYLDRHAPRYAGVGYAVRKADDFRVGPEFPRIIEADLPLGVGDASYQLSLAACAGFSTPPATLTAALVPLST